ncbi:hypothetical protein AB0G04_09065 [Actinoplanes sp. NPDC023801]|uniref:hypothetical protein n=1 Tax=Actinoplanes sp. NPDC023801 TaxID=3154595 RepID=UPI00340D6F4A
MSRRHSRSFPTAVAAAVAVATIGAPPAPASAVPPPAPGGSVTLPTGDRVLLRPGARPGQDVVVRPAAGREKVRFQRVHRDGRVLVLPADRAVAVWSGAADAAAFDVTSALGQERSAAVRSAADTVPLTIRVLDHDGRPATTWTSTLDDVDRPASFAPFDASGTAVVQVPRGTYFLNAKIDTVRDGRTLSTHISEPAYVVDGPATVTLDARDGKPTGITVDEPTAVPGEVAVIFERTTNDGRTLGYSGHGPNFEGLLVRPSTTSSAAFSYAVAGRLARPDGTGGFAGSPYLYHLQWVEPGRIPAEPIRHVPDAGLAEVRAELSATTPGRIGRKDYLVSGKLPFTIRELYIPATPWLSAVEEFDGPVTGTPVSTVYSGERYFEANTTGAERWNSAVFGPSFPSPWPWSWTRAVRTGNTIDVELPLFTDQGLRREGRSATTSASTTLHRDGILVGSSAEAGKGSFTVPAAAGRYQLAARATRQSAVSPEVDVRWRFRSAAATAASRLPLAAVRFTPRLDADNRAPGGCRFEVPLQVQWQHEAAHGTVRSLSVQASYDDGRTWQNATLRGSGEQRTAVLNHPHTARHVSLRATVVDSDGNRVDQTVKRAYLLTH